MLNPSTPPTQAVWLVDTSIYVYRAWHTKEPPLLDQQGHPINAVRGFLRWLYAFLHENRPIQIAFAFDEAQIHSIRRNLAPTYKAQRKPVPDELKYQFQLCREFLGALGLVTYSSPQFEADDIIGTWVQQQDAHTPCHIISGDKDLMQLVRDIDVWWDYGKRPPLNEGKIKKVTGVWPKQIPDQLALAGDAADNIKGIDGIGLASAAKILHKFTSIEVLFMRLPEMAQLKNLRYAKLLQERIGQQEAQLRLNKQLTKICCDVPNVPHDLKRKATDLETLSLLGEQLGLSTEQLALWAKV